METFEERVKRIDKMAGQLINEQEALKIRGLNHSNPFVRKKVEFDTFINSDRFESKDNLNGVFSVLDKISIDDKYVLDDYRSKVNTNSILELYARPADTPRPTDKEWLFHEGFSDIYCNEVRWELERITGKKFISPLFSPEKEVSEYLKELGYTDKKDFPKCLPFLDYIIVDYNDMSIWQAFLLINMYTVYGMRYHGLYNSQKFVYDNYQLKYFDNDDPKIPKSFLPEITLNDDNIAFIKYYYLNFDNSLKYCTFTLQYDCTTKRIVKFDSKRECIIKKERLFDL